MTTDRRSLVLRGVLDVCVLGLLEEAHVYGYELVDRLAGYGLTVAGGSVYPLLARLHKAGLVTSEVLDGVGGPPRRYYSLSADGALELARGRQEWTDISDAVEKTLATRHETTTHTRTTEGAER